jgi:cytochrome bd-type quinol oxidase subunit 2
MLLGGTLACYAAYTGIKTFESGFGPIIGLVLMLFGLSIARNAFLLLKADDAAAERLTRQFGIIAVLSLVAIGAMVAQADFDTDAAKTQLLGFITALVLSVAAIVLSSLPATTAYTSTPRPSTSRQPPRIG